VTESSVSFPLTGGCVCGGVRYEVSEPFTGSGYCHCTRCQRRTGTAASANAATRSLRIVQGEDLVSEWTPEGGFTKAFCSRCGSALWSLDPNDRDRKGLRLGTLDGDPGIRPTYRQYLNYAAVWEPVPDDGLAHHRESRNG
jgi:hypothetical protein